MSNIRSKGTKVEKIVFSELRRRGVYFQKHYSRAIGNPDIALPRKKVAVFIDGDFWHGNNHSDLKKRLPEKYWQQKIQKNINRDVIVNFELRNSGWKVLRIWESEIIKHHGSIEKIVEHLTAK